MKFKRDILYLLVIIILLGAVGQLYYSRVYQPEHDIAVYYSYDHPLNEEVIQTIRNADKFVYFAVYTFTRQDIEDALLAAKYRGLTVIGVTDKQQLAEVDQQKTVIHDLEKAGIPVYIQDHSGIMHMKVVVTDKGYASGSYNWTAAATNVNDEVLEVGRDAKIRSAFQSILEELFSKYKNHTAP